MSDFNKHAQQSPEQLERAFSGPLGPMLGKMGILSQEQQDESGMVQAQMIAIRTAIETGVLAKLDAAATLGEFKGNLDFGTLAKSSADDRHNLLDSLGITASNISNAQKVVQYAQEYRSNVNADHDIQVSPIGFIHMDLHAKNIPNFGDIKQGALIAQRAIDAAHSIERIQNNDPDSAASSKRGFKLWGDETPDLQNIVFVADGLNEDEKRLENGETISIEGSEIRVVNRAFDAAAQKFKDAGQTNLAASIKDVKIYLLNNDKGDTPGASPQIPILNK